MDLEEYSYFVSEALRQMLALAEELGDDGVTRLPDGVSTAPASGLITQSVGVVDYWIGALLARRDVAADRAAGRDHRASVEELREAVTGCLDQLHRDLAAINLAHRPRTADRALRGPQRSLTGTGVLLYVLAEVSRHHGELEMLAAQLLAPRGS